MHRFGGTCFLASLERKFGLSGAVKKIEGYTYNGEVRLFLVWIEEILFCFSRSLSSYHFAQIPFRVYNIFFFFPFFIPLLSHFHFPNHPHSLRFLLISRLSFLPFSPSLVYYSFFSLAPPSPCSSVFMRGSASLHTRKHTLGG